MLQQLLITIGAGVASAVFFYLPAKGSLFAFVLGLFASLPLLIVAFGYGVRSAVIAAAAGALLAAAMLDGWLAIAFLLSVAFPALVLGHMAARPSPDESALLRGLLCTIVAVTIALDFLGIFVIGSRYASFDAAIDDLASRFEPLISAVFARTGVPGGATAKEFSATLVLAMGPVMAAWGVFALALNCWIAGRVTLLSGRLARPWPDVARHLGLPRWTIMVFALLFALTLSTGAIRLLAMTAAAALGAALALVGLAILHWRSRGSPARAGILIATYGACILVFPWPLVLLAGLGFAELATPNGLRPPANPSTPNA